MRLKKLLRTGLITLSLAAQSLTFSTVNVFAEEAGVMNEAPPEEGGDAAAEGEAVEGELPEGEMPEGEGAEGQQGGSGVAVSGIQADNGLYIASSFPESEMPAGFSTSNVNYQGEDIMLAQMVTKSTSIGTEGMTVTLAYLTDEDGSNGEFDVTENAKMSDMIKIDGADGRYIIVLDPGDNITGPDGFAKHNLSWGSKSAVAWSLPAYTSDEEEKDEEKEDEDKKDEDKEAEDSDAKIQLFSVNVYAQDLFAAGAGSGEDEEGGAESGGAEEDASEEAAKEAAEKAMSDYIEESNIAHTNASGLIEAQPDDFCLLYAVDEEGNVGFYLYDIAQKIYQRYVDIPKGEGAALAKYRKQSRIRLIIIIVLAVLLLVAIFALINTLARGKDRDTYNDGGRRYRDDDEDIRDLKSRMDRSRRRPARREENYLRDRDEGFDDDDDEDEEDGDYYGNMRDERSYRSRSAAPSGRRPAPAQQPQHRGQGGIPAGAPRGAAPSRGGSAAGYDAPRSRAAAEDDVRRDPRRRPQQGAPAQRPPRGAAAPRRGSSRDDIDDDFEFEYLKFNK